MSFTVEEDKPLVEDFLSVDQPVPGQNFCCLSFVSPEKILRRKSLFLIKAFLKDLFDKPENGEQYDADQKEVLKKIRWEKFNRLFEGDYPYQTVEDLFENFRVTKEDEVNKQFDEQNDFQTSVRGLKVRGTYDTRREAEVRAEVLRRKDPNFNVFVGQVGYWLPWDPEPAQIAEQVDQEQQLNELVKRYKENRERVDEEFQQRKEESLKAAREENKKRKEALAKQVEEGGDDEELPELSGPTQKPTDTEEEAQKKLSELRQTLKEKDSGYASMMGQPDPWMARKQAEKENDREDEHPVDRIEGEDVEKELQDIGSKIF